MSTDQVPDRKGRPLFVIDLAVPRDVDPEIAALDDCYLYDIDDLEAVVSESMSGRWREAARAESITSHEARRFRDWQASRDVVPAIASLRERAETIRSGELAKAESRLEGLSESERRTVESLTTQIVNKLLHVPIVRMKEAAADRGLGLRRSGAAPVRPRRGGTDRWLSSGARDLGSEAAEVGSR